MEGLRLTVAAAEIRAMCERRALRADARKVTTGENGATRASTLRFVTRLLAHPAFAPAERESFAELTRRVQTDALDDLRSTFDSAQGWRFIAAHLADGDYTLTLAECDLLGFFDAAKETVMELPDAKVICDPRERVDIAMMAGGEDAMEVLAGDYVSADAPTRPQIEQQPASTPTCGATAQPCGVNETAVPSQEQLEPSGAV